MTCEEIKNILLTESQTEVKAKWDTTLKEHVTSCEVCSKYYLTINAIERSAQDIEQNVNQIDYSAILRSVLKRIEKNEKHLEQSIAAKISDYMFSQVFRVAYIFTLVCLCIWYFNVEYTDNSKIVKLETRLNILDDRQTIDLPMNATSYADIRGIIDKAVRLLNLNAVDDSQIFLNPNYNELLGIFIQSEVERNEKLKSLLQNTNISYEDGISAEELEILLKNKKEISEVLGLFERGK